MQHPTRDTHQPLHSETYSGGVLGAFAVTAMIILCHGRKLKLNTSKGRSNFRTRGLKHHQATVLNWLCGCGMGHVEEARLDLGEVCGPVRTPTLDSSP